MESPKISYTDPVSRSFDAVKRTLFGPFDIGKWFALGFSAWLATLLSGGSSFNANFNTGDSMGDPEIQQAFQAIGAWIEANMSLVIALVVAIVLISIAIYLVMLWVSSRGKFMFLDNLVHNRALVKTPWMEFKTLGNSLFIWRLVFGLIVFGVAALFGGGVFYYIFVVSETGLSKAPAVLLFIAAALIFLIGALVVAYITIMLEYFVIPIMYRDRLTTTAAWSRFLELHNRHFWKFVLFFLWSAVLSIGAAMALATIGVLTCCIGLVVMAIPYIGAVVILPVTTFFRMFGPEFLRQFGPDYDIFPSPEPPVVPQPVQPAPEA